MGGLGRKLKVPGPENLDIALMVGNQMKKNQKQQRCEREWEVGVFSGLWANVEAERDKGSG